MSDPILRQAGIRDAEPLTALTIASKAYWGYSKDFMAKALPYLRVTPEQIETSHTYVLEVSRRIVGYHQLYPRDARMIWLESLFVLPDSMGKGYGSRLLDHALKLAVALGFQRLDFESDPFAEAFYLKHGAIRIGGRESSVLKGRMLPLMRFDLARFPSPMPADYPAPP